MDGTRPNAKGAQIEILGEIMRLWLLRPRDPKEYLRRKQYVAAKRAKRGWPVRPGQGTPIDLGWSTPPAILVEFQQTIAAIDSLRLETG